MYLITYSHLVPRLETPSWTGTTSAFFTSFNHTQKFSTSARLSAFSCVSNISSPRKRFLYFAFFFLWLLSLCLCSSVVVYKIWLNCCHGNRLGEAIRSNCDLISTLFLIRIFSPPVHCAQSQHSIQNSLVEICNILIHYAHYLLEIILILTLCLLWARIAQSL